MHHRSRFVFSRIAHTLRIALPLGRHKTSSRRKALGRRKTLPLLICLIAAFVPLLLTYSTVSAASVQDQQTQQAQHALLVSSQPAADAVLQSPPPSVKMWFSEALIPATSKALVVDTTNRQVDLKDSHVSDSNGQEMDLTLPLLPAGTYVVVWQSQSATDGHVASGSFLFRIARPDGSIPPVPAVLPTGHVPGAGGIGVQSSTSLDGPTLLQTIAIWISLLLFTFWVGGIIWETWIFAPKNHSPFDHPTAIAEASQRWRTYMPYALLGIFIANVGIIVGQAAELAGNWSGGVSFPLLHAILFESHFGTFWCLREGVTLVALLSTVGQTRTLRHRQESTKSTSIQENMPEAQDTDVSAQQTQDALLRGGPALMKVLADIPHLPKHLVEGIRQCSWYGRMECLLGLTLALAFALSGHAASASSSVVWATLSIDLLHLLADAAWVGGLLYISLVLLPTLNKHMEGSKPLLHKAGTSHWADVLAVGLPRFSVIAITSVILLAATGSFNTTVHLTSFQQFWTTAYGRTLTVKIGVFLLMIGISTYHAFFLRPRLACTLAETKAALVGAVPYASPKGSPTDNLPLPQNNPNPAHEETISPHALILGKRLEHWLRLEGMLGAIVLLCVALLAAFAGSLTTSTAATTASSQPTGSVTQTKTVDGYVITLKVTPATFGTNTFLVLVNNTQGQPQTGAAVSINTTMLDMDMGTQTTQLQADPKQPGVYSQQADLTMAGHWEVGVRVLPVNSDTFVKATFDFSAS